MKCCPDRLKQAVMVTGRTGHIFYHMAKTLAPKNLVDKVVVFSERRAAGKFLIEKGIVKKGGSSTGSISTKSSSNGPKTSKIQKVREENFMLPTFLGGTFGHERQITMSLPLMLSKLCCEEWSNTNYKITNAEI